MTPVAAKAPPRKVCSRCGKRKAIEEFPSNGPGKVRSECRACKRLADRERRAARSIEAGREPQRGPGRPRKAATASRVKAPKAPTARLAELVAEGRVAWHQCDGRDAHPAHREIHRRGFWSEGHRAVTFIEDFCVYPDGPKVGEIVGSMIPWQREATFELLRVRDDGRSQYRRALIGVAKKNNKTAWVGWLALYFLVDNKHRAGRIVNAAASEDQADLVFGYAKITAETSPVLNALTGGNGKGSLRYEGSIGVTGMPSKMIQRLAVGGGNLDGKNILATIEDELHEWRTPKSVTTHTVLNRGLILNPESIAIYVTTAGFDTDTIEGGLYEYGKKLESGEVRDETFLFIWYEAPEVCSGRFKGPYEGRKGTRVDYRSREGWEAANPSAGYTVTYERYLDDLSDPQMTESVARRYHLNQHTNVEVLWMPAPWKTFERQPFPAFDPEKRTVCAVDGSVELDATAITVWEVEGRGAELRARSRSWVWERPVGPDGQPEEGWTVPSEEVTHHLFSMHFGTEVEGASWSRNGKCVHCDEAFAPLEFEAVGCDPARIASLMREWELEGVPVVKIPQGVRMAQGYSTFYALLKTHRFEHDGDPVVERHIKNSTTRLDTEGNQRLDRRRTSQRKPNDAAISNVICAYLVSEPEDDSDEINFY